MKFGAIPAYTAAMSTHVGQDRPSPPNPALPMEQVQLVQPPTRRPSSLLERLGAVLIVTGAVVLGGGLRFHELGHDGLWSDELFTSSMIRQHPLTADISTFRRTTIFDVTPEDSFWTAKGAEQSPPLFELLTKAVLTILPASEFSLRLVSAVAGCLWLLFLALRVKSTEDPLLRRTYLVAAVFGAVSVSLIEYSQEARAYGVGALCTGIITVRWLERWYSGFMSAKLPRAGELAIFVLGCHAHYNVVVFSALVLGSYGIVALRTKRFADLARLAIVPLACVPWVALNAHTIVFTSGGGVGWRPIGPGEALQGAFRCALELPGRALLVVAAGLAGLHLIRRTFRSQTLAPKVRTTVLAMLALSVVYVVLVAFVTMRAGMMHPRYYLYMLPGIHLGIALMLAATVTSTGAQSVVLLCLLGGSALDLDAYYSKERDGHREATAWLRSQTTEARPTIIHTWRPNLAMKRFYLESYFDSDADDRAIGISSPSEAHSVCQRVGAPKRVLLLSQEAHRRFAEAALAACSHKFRLTDERTIRGVFGQVWTLREPDETSGRDTLEGKTP